MANIDEKALRDRANREFTKMLAKLHPANITWGMKEEGIEENSKEWNSRLQAAEERFKEKNNDYERESFIRGRLREAGVDIADIGSAATQNCAWKSDGAGWDDFFKDFATAFNEAFFKGFSDEMMRRHRAQVQAVEDALKIYGSIIFKGIADADSINSMMRWFKVHEVKNVIEFATYLPFILDGTSAGLQIAESVFKGTELTTVSTALSTDVAGIQDSDTRCRIIFRLQNLYSWRHPHYMKTMAMAVPRIAELITDPQLRGEVIFHVVGHINNLSIDPYDIVDVLGRYGKDVFPLIKDENLRAQSIKSMVNVERKDGLEKVSMGRPESFVVVAAYAKDITTGMEPKHAEAAIWHMARRADCVPSFAKNAAAIYALVKSSDKRNDIAREFLTYSCKKETLDALGQHVQAIVGAVRSEEVRASIIIKLGREGTAKQIGRLAKTANNMFTRSRRNEDSYLGLVDSFLQQERKK